MRTFKQYLPESFLTELGEGPGDSGSPISGAEAIEKTDPTAARDGNRELNIGDPVIIKGKVCGQGCRGVVDSFDEGNKFVVVDLYDHGKQSFNIGDVAFDDYTYRDEEDDEPDREMMDLRRLSGYTD